MAQKSITESLEAAITAWKQHIQTTIQTDFQSATGVPLGEVTLAGQGSSSTLEISVPPRKEMTGIKSQEQDVWVPPTTYATKDKNGRPTMRKRKGYKRKQKIELETEESSSPRADSKPSQTGTVRWVREKIIDYHFKKDFGNFLAQHLGKDHKVKIK